MTLKTLLNAVVAALQAAATPQLAAAKVYKGDMPAWADHQGIFVIPAGGGEGPVGIGDQFADLHHLYILVRMPCRDPATSGAATSEADWFDKLLDTVQEIRDLFSTRDNRRITDTAGDRAWKMKLLDSTFGYVTEGTREMWAYLLEYKWWVDQP